MTAESPDGERAERLLLWSSLWGGGAAWMLHLLSAWVLAEFGCMSALAGGGPLGVSRVAWSVLAATLICLILCGLALRASWRCGRRRDQSESAGFVFRYGLAANPLFMMIILVQTVPVFYHLKDCGTYILP